MTKRTYDELNNIVTPSFEVGGITTSLSNSTDYWHEATDTRKKVWIHSRIYIRNWFINKENRDIIHGRLDTFKVQKACKRDMIYMKEKIDEYLTGFAIPNVQISEVKRVTRSLFLTDKDVDGAIEFLTDKFTHKDFPLNPRDLCLVIENVEYLDTNLLLNIARRLDEYIEPYKLSAKKKEVAKKEWILEARMYCFTADALEKLIKYLSQTDKEDDNSVVFDNFKEAVIKESEYLEVAMHDLVVDILVESTCMSNSLDVIAILDPDFDDNFRPLRYWLSMSKERKNNALVGVETLFNLINYKYYLNEHIVQIPDFYPLLVRHGVCYEEILFRGLLSANKEYNNNLFYMYFNCQVAHTTTIRTVIERKIARQVSSTHVKGLTDMVLNFIFWRNV